MIRSLRAYSLSLVFVAIAFLLNRTLHTVAIAMPFAIFFSAVIFSAWFGGTGPAILAMVVSAFLAKYYFFVPFHQLWYSPADLIRSALFLATCCIIIFLTSRERRQSRKLTSILDGIADGFMSLDRRWNVTRANRRASELTGKDLVGKNLWSESPDAPDSMVWEKLHRVMQERAPVSYEHYFAPLQRWFEVDCFPTQEGISLFFRDVTGRKQAEESLRASEARYRFLAESMSQYVWTTDEKGTWITSTGTSLSSPD